MERLVTPEKEKPIFTPAVGSKTPPPPPPPPPRRPSAAASLFADVSSSPLPPIGKHSESNIQSEHTIVDDNNINASLAALDKPTMPDTRRKASNKQFYSDDEL